MVPGEQIMVRDFDGRERRVSGSSYAAARVSALAACLLSGHPEWSTAELKAALFAKALPDPHHVARGFIPDDALGRRGACASHS
jgi:subtilisin family serine protease